MSTYAQNQGKSPIQNTNRWDTKQLVTIALMAAIAILLSFAEYPIIPSAPFLKLDVALVPATVVGFAYGPGPGILVGVVSAVGHAIYTSNWVGALMNIIVTCCYVLPASLIYQRNRTFKGGMIGLAVSFVCLVVGAVIANLIIDPTFYFMKFDDVVALIIPAIIPFNVIKGLVVSGLTGLVYKSISNFITPAKNQVKGR